MPAEQTPRTVSDPSAPSRRAADLARRGRMLVSCPDRPGIVAAVSRFWFDHGANIIHSDQHSTASQGGTFFMRVEIDLPSLPERLAELERGFGSIAAEFDMDWRLTWAGHVKRLAVFVSRAEHCLLELLWQQQAGDLEAEIAMVISNHEYLRPIAESWGIPFHHVPVDRGSKRPAEEAQLELVAGRVDALVLARYMQILSADFIARWPNRVINIHHGFLPAFVGARAYEQAYDHGVKLIGATAHYVTEDLDAGPIIEQDVQRVDHGDSPEDLKRIGRHVERTVLARAVAWHVEDRILIDGSKTVVFA